MSEVPEDPGTTRPAFLRPASPLHLVAPAASELPPWTDVLLGRVGADGVSKAGPGKLWDALEVMPHDEQRVAEAIGLRYGTRLFYCLTDEELRFRAWDGRVWVDAGARLRVQGLVQELLLAYEKALREIDQAIQQDADQAAAKVPDADKTKRKDAVLRVWHQRFGDHFKLGKRLATHAGQQAIWAHLGAIAGHSRAEADFDTGSVFVCGNVALDFGVMRESTREDVTREPWLEPLEHSPARLVTQLADVDYLPEVGIGPLWAGYLEAALPDEADRWFLQRALGSALLGQPRDKLLVNTIGPPDSGKSLFLNVIRGVFGTYAVAASPDTFMKRDKKRDPGAPSADLDRLKGAWLVTAVEPNPGDKWDSGILKSITGRDPQISRGMRENNRQWIPRMLLVVASNQVVDLDVSDEAMTQRIFPVAFPHRFRRPGPELRAEDIAPEDLADQTLEDRILASSDERAGVLCWLVSGLRGYLAEGLEPSAGVLQARKALIAQLSPARRWLDEQLVCGRIIQDPPGAKLYQAIGSREAYEDFERWWREGHEDVEERYLPKPRTFNKDIRVLGSTALPYDDLKTSGWRYGPNGDPETVRCFDRLFWSNWELRTRPEAGKK